ncbi:MAG: D-tyrosyl-tRNA(Tyr) deacylase [Vicinamibacteria bacterium]|nr:D-tyrosyl-tRNA(Tyr) deacylase [Vicinamibacteria bacterium]
MRAVIQRVSRAHVSIEGKRVAAIGRGLLVLLGVDRDDTEQDAAYLAEKTAYLRVFPDENGRMNRSALEAGGALLVVSQFTLFGDCRKGHRPSYSQAADPDSAERLYRAFVVRCRAYGLPVDEGVFRAMMNVELVNDGPVTLLLDSRRGIEP